MKLNFKNSRDYNAVLMKYSL